MPNIIEILVCWDPLSSNFDSPFLNLQEADGLCFLKYINNPRIIVFPYFIVFYLFISISNKVVKVQRLSPHQVLSIVISLFFFFQTTYHHISRHPTPSYLSWSFLGDHRWWASSTSSIFQSNPSRINILRLQVHFFDYTKKTYLTSKSQLPRRTIKRRDTRGATPYLKVFCLDIQSSPGNVTCCTKFKPETKHPNHFHSTQFHGWSELRKRCTDKQIVVLIFLSSGYVDLYFMTEMQKLDCCLYFCSLNSYKLTE